MLKTEIGREQLDFVSDNLSANFNACSRIFIFLSSISKSPHPPTHPRRNIFEKTSSDTSFTLDKSELSEECFIRTADVFFSIIGFRTPSAPAAYSTRSRPR